MIRRICALEDLYRTGNREFQDEFDSRRLADRLLDVIVHDRITEQDRGFITARDMFFISTVDDLGRPTVSYKGGKEGFVQVLDDKTIAFPGYDGNGMFLTAGNINSRPDVGLLFIDLENPMRLRLHGTASIDLNDPLIDAYDQAQYITRVRVRNIFVNCPRYVHRYKKIETSEYVPTEAHAAPVPDWKGDEAFKDVLPKK